MAQLMTPRTKFLLDEDQIPRAWYNIAADLPEPPPPVLHPGHRPADRARRPRAALPDGADQAGRQPGPRDRDPRSGPRRLRALPAEPALSRPPAREGARYARPHLLQVRGRQPVGQPQAEHGARRRRSTTRTEGVTRLATETGAGQWGSALAFAGRRVRARGQGLHGPRQLRPEAVPADPDGDLRRRRSCPARRRTPQYGRKVLAENPDHTGSLGHRHQRGDRGHRHASGHEVLARARCSTSSCSTRP